LSFSAITDASSAGSLLGEPCTPWSFQLPRVPVASSPSTRSPSTTMAADWLFSTHDPALPVSLRISTIDAVCEPVS
jgi:hypothetical protein